MRGVRCNACLLAVLAVLGVLTVASPQSPAARASQCTGATTRAAFAAFVTALNRGDLRRLDALFAEQPAFEWYSSPGPGRRLGAEAKSRATLISYFWARHRAEERLGLRYLRFNGNSGRHGNFELGLRRSVPAVADGDWLRLGGKGAAICNGDTVRFVVVSLGAAEPGR